MRWPEGVGTFLRRLALLPDSDAEESGEGIEMYDIRKLNSQPLLSSYRPLTWQRRLVPVGEQRFILLFMGIVAVLVFILSEFKIGRMLLYPFAIISTVFHEFGHATVAWLTGGTMGSIQIEWTEAGATRFSGGWPCLILPAGYIGSTAVGALLVFLAFGRRTARWTTIGVMAILAITLLYAHDLFTLISAVFLLVLLGGAWWYKDGAFARHFIIILGVCASLNALTSIINTTVFHTIKGSDAYEFSKRCSILIPAFMYGILWFIVSLAIQALSIAAGLVFFR